MNVKGFLYCLTLASAVLVCSCKKDAPKIDTPESSVSISLDMMNCPDDVVKGMSLLAFASDSSLSKMIVSDGFTADSVASFSLAEGSYKVLLCTNVGTEVALSIPDDSVSLSDVNLVPLVTTAFQNHPHIGFTEFSLSGGKAVNQSVVVNRLLADFGITLTGITDEVTTIRATLLNAVSSVNIGTLSYGEGTYSVDCGTVEVADGIAVFSRRVCMPTSGPALFRLDLIDASGNVYSEKQLSVVAFKNGGIYNVEADYSYSEPIVFVNGINIIDWEDGDDMNMGAEETN